MAVNLGSIREFGLLVRCVGGLSSVIPIMAEKTELNRFKEANHLAMREQGSVLF